MAKLVVLSETDNLDYLRKHGIYPSQFFTDLKSFEKMSSFFHDVKVCCILSGSCAFSRRKLSELINFMQERINDSESNSIKELYIFSDTDVFKGDYYRHNGNLGCVDLMRGKKTIEKGINPWKTLQFEPSATTVRHLRDEHKGNVSSALRSYHGRVQSKKVGLEDVVQRPKVL